MLLLLQEVPCIANIDQRMVSQIWFSRSCRVCSHNIGLLDTAALYATLEPGNWVMTATGVSRVDSDIVMID